MNLADNCRETFLEGVSDLYLYPCSASRLPIPFSVPQIQSMIDCQFAEPALHVSLNNEEYVLADKMTVKVTSNIMSLGTVYSTKITADITYGKDNVREIAPKLQAEDHYAVLRKVDGTFVLGYTLPGTFSFLSSDDMDGNSHTYNINISLQSMSDFIPVTIK